MAAPNAPLRQYWTCPVFRPIGARPPVRPRRKSQNSVSPFRSREPSRLPLYVGVLGLVLAHPAGAGPDNPEAPGQLLTRSERFADGSVQRSISYYINEQGTIVSHGPTTGYWPDGTKHFEIHFRYGLRHGPARWWHPGGALAREGQYTYERETGIWTWYQVSGERLSQCTYINGTKVGVEKIWGSPGPGSSHTLRGEDTYDKDGHLIHTIRWHPNGKKRVEGHYRPATRAELAKQDPFLVVTLRTPRHGRWTYYDTDENEIAVGDWKDGQPWDGVCGVFLRQGRSGGHVRFGRYQEGEKVDDLEIATHGFP
jgi:antitoxin component YwqK of YwqJK toxin-antitoxin module